MDDLNQASLVAWGDIAVVARSSLTAEEEDSSNTGSGSLELQNYVIRAEVDPVSFAYFVAANLPLASSTRQQILELDRVVDRLRSVRTEPIF